MGREKQGPLVTYPSVDRVIAFTRLYANHMKAAKPLIVLIKYLLMQNGLDDTRAGGIGGYAIALMVFYFVNHVVSATVLSPQKTSYSASFFIRVGPFLQLAFCFFRFLT